MSYILKRSNKKDKKWMVTSFGTIRNPRKKTVHFGARGYQDYTQHKDADRKRLYIIRHQKKENWGKRGIGTAGFWSRWLLWNKPSLISSIRDTQRKFGIKISR